MYIYMYTHTHTHSHTHSKSDTLMGAYNELAPLEQWGAAAKDIYIYIYTHTHAHTYTNTHNESDTAIDRAPTISSRVPYIRSSCC